MLTILFYLVSLIPAVITQIFNPTTEFAMSIRIPTKEAKTEMETQPVTAVAKTSKCSMKPQDEQTFLSFSIIKSFWLISSMKQFLVLYI